MNQISKPAFLGMIYDVMGTDNIDTSGINFDNLERLNKKIEDVKHLSDRFRLSPVILTSIRFIVCDIVVNLNCIIPDKCNETVEEYIYKMCGIYEDIEDSHKAALLRTGDGNCTNMIFNSYSMVLLYTDLMGCELPDNILDKLDEFGRTVTNLLAEDEFYKSLPAISEVINIVTPSHYVGYTQAITDLVLRMSCTANDLVLTMRLITNNIKSLLIDKLLCGVSKESFFKALPYMKGFHIYNDINIDVDLYKKLTFESTVVKLIDLLEDLHARDIREYCIDKLATIIPEYHMNLVTASVDGLIKFINNKANSLTEESEETTMETPTKTFEETIIHTPIIKLGDQETSTEFNVSRDIMEKILEMTERSDELGNMDNYEDEEDGFEDNHLVTDTIRENLIARINEILEDVVCDEFEKTITSNMDKDTTCGEFCECTCGCDCGHSDSVELARGTYEQLLLHLTYNVKTFANRVLSKMDLVNTYTSHDYYQAVLDLVESTTFVWINGYGVMIKNPTEKDYKTFRVIQNHIKSILADLTNNEENFQLDDFSTKFTILKLMTLDLLCGVCSDVYRYISKGNYIDESPEIIELACGLIYNLSDINNYADEWLD